ncbi:nucleoside monophosphate kinase [Maribacter aquivivus]|uniref:nucleoside monophosphate kinase n=1 Tax=Maribacter aquivivus TaxID=228958 RepID=UPI00249365C5|nr:nucleoside monophosphate kinase [Maribacter aquivivus]
MKKLDILFVDWGLSKVDIENILSEIIGFEIFNFPNLLRKELQNKSKLSEEIQEELNSGELLNNKLIEKFITKNLKEKPEALLLTYYPNIVEQFSVLKKILLDENIALNKIWYFKIRNQKEFMKHHFEVSINQKHLDKYGEEITNDWINRFEERRKNFDNIKSAANSVEWTDIEIDYVSDLTVEYLRKRIKDCA